MTASELPALAGYAQAREHRIVVYQGALERRGHGDELILLGGGDTVVMVIDGEGRRLAHLSLSPAQAIRLAALLLARLEAKEGELLPDGWCTP